MHLVMGNELSNDDRELRMMSAQVAANAFALSSCFKRPDIHH